METESNHIEIKLDQVVQNSNVFYTGIIDVVHIKNLFTTSPAIYKLSNLETNKLLDVSDYDEYIKKLKSLEGYQRDIINQDKVNEIAEYISDESEYHIIPNSILFSLDAVFLNGGESIEGLIKDNPLQFYISESEPGKFSLIIPRKIISESDKASMKKLLVIDGHHRLRGIVSYLNQSSEKSFQILGTFIINQDPVVEAELFTTVNYKIKPVNKSYLYHVLGEFGVGKREFIYLHYLVRILNESSDSPLYGRIKMLGKSDSSVTIKQSLSQSFLVEQLYVWTLQELNRINRNKTLKRIPVFRYYLYSNSTNIITKVLTRYLLAVEKCFNNFYKNEQWNSDSNQYLKTIGFGALVEILPSIIISIIFDKSIVNKQEKLIEIKIKDFEKYLISIFNANFDSRKILKEEYSKGSSQGLVKSFAIQLWGKIVNVDAHYQEKEKLYLDWFENNKV